MKKLKLLFLMLTVCLLTVALASCSGGGLGEGEGNGEGSACTHEWGEGETTTAATCTEDGAKKFTCALCNEERTETVAATGHSYGDPVIVNATCTEDGSSTRTCTACGDAITETITAAHDWQDEPTYDKLPTCTEKGAKTLTCTVCNGTTTEEIAALGHTETTDAAKAPTCTETGLTEGKHCTVCNEVTVAQAVVGALGHTAQEGTYKAPTCTEDGWSLGGSCTVCGEDLGDDAVIPATGHTCTTVVTAPTCTVGGFTTYTCHCGHTYVADEVDALGHTEVDDAAKAPTCTETGLTAGKHCSVCNAVTVAQTLIGALGHTEVDDAAKAATCTETGLTAGKHCSVCNAVTVAQTVIGALGHTEVTDAAKAPTCTEDGITAGKHCSVCNTVTVAQTVDPATGHAYGAPVVVPYTCTADGTSTKTCGSCGKVESSVLPAAHRWEAEASVDTAATCIADGQKSVKCTACGITDSATITVIPKLSQSGSHTWGEEVVVQSTCAEMGTRTKTCTVCGYQSIKTIVKKSHTYTTTSSTAATCGKNGLKVETCSGCGGKKETVIQATGNHVTAATDTYISVAPTESQDGTKTAYCDACDSWTTTAFTYSEYKSMLDSEKSSNNFSLSGTTSISSSSTSNIKAYPTAGEHPRLLINTEVLATIRAALEAEETRDEMNQILLDVVYKANYYTAGGNLGSTSSPTYPTSWPSGTHNYNQEVLNAIMSKAFLYLYTGVEYYGVEATRWIKEYLNTLKMEKGVNDRERYYGYTMFAAAIVYDWCYDAMTDADRENIVKGIKTIASGSYSTGWFSSEANMEIGFPPSKQGSVSGHGCEYQLLRDYLAVSLAIYDEYPAWYEYVGERFFKEYVPVRNAFYEAGMYPQGISVYIGIRFTSDLWSAWLMQSATGYNPYVGQEQVIRSIFSRVVDGMYYFFDEGDDQRDIEAWGQGELKRYVFAANISAYLYNDTTAAAWAEGAWISNASQRETWKYNDNVNVFRIIFRSTGVSNTGSRHEGLDLICYNGGFMNEIVAHGDWSNNSASVLMKIGGYTVGNHDHGDAGSFQIYYKGILAGDTGFYDSYDSTHHNNYHQATIAHNSIVIYNGTKSYGQKTGLSTNDSMTYSDWMNKKESTYKQGTVTGVAYEYKDTAKTSPKYAYIAGDITSAYSTSSSYAKGVERRMLAVFDTSNSNVPMYFFVYDRVTTGSANYQAAFLLHTAAEPTISGNTVTVNSGGKYTNGKLVLQNVLGAGTIEAIGGDGKNYVVNGSQVATEDGEDDCYWGRVEIKTATGTTEHSMVNVMYVTDKSKNPGLTAQLIQTDKVAGAIIGNSAAIFVENETRYGETLTFTAPNAGTSTINYYVSGVKAGKWQVQIGATKINATVTDESGLLVFRGAVNKEVTLTYLGEA